MILTNQSQSGCFAHRAAIICVLEKKYIYPLLLDYLLCIWTELLNVEGMQTVDENMIIISLIMVE